LHFDVDMDLKRRLQRMRVLLAVFCAVAIAPGNTFALVLSRAQSPTQTSASGDEASRIPAEQLDSLVAPIALYPDPLLAQTLAASTYPLELMQLQQWLARNPGLQDKALADSAAKQPWDPSIQAMALLPDVVKRLTDDIQWTTDLGNAFLAQQSDVMDAVQRMRQKAQTTGNLKSTPQQRVETEVVESKQVIVIEQADPQVVYVPEYNPTVVYGAPIYPYPPIYYPPAGYYAAGAAISFGVGVAMGAAWGGGWGWNAGWGGNDININNNNNFNRNANVNANRAGNVANRSGNWQHNAAHRGGAPYRDRATANRYGGTARGDSLANRQAGARQQVQRQGGNVRSGAVGTSGRASSLGDRAGAGGGNLGDRAGGGAGNLGDRARGGGGGLGDRGGAGGGNLGGRAGGGGDLGGRTGGGNLGNRPSQLPSGGDRIGGRDISRGSGGGAFGGGSDGFSGSSARASSSRGSSSMRSGGSRSGSFGGGGGSRSGGFGGGGGGRSRGGGGSRGGGRR
jgi:Protein of unknown function (DUF3300)